MARLTNEQLSAVQDYETYSDALNAALLAGNPPPNPIQAAHLRAAILHQTTRDALTVYRACTWNSVARILTNGGRYPAFLSTSRADQLVHRYYGDAESARLTVHVPAGMAALDVDAVTGGNGEQEILLASCAEFSVESHDCITDQALIQSITGRPVDMPALHDMHLRLINYASGCP